jgi:hypothetical protein
MRWYMMDYWNCIALLMALPCMSSPSLRTVAVASIARINLIIPCRVIFKAHIRIIVYGVQAQIWHTGHRLLWSRVVV